MPALKSPVTSLARLAVPAAILLFVGGCAQTGEITGDSSIGITALRSVCPQVGVPAGTGDVTLFNPPASVEAQAIDVSAVLTNVKSDCSDSDLGKNGKSRRKAGASAGGQVVTTVNFDVFARREHTEGARDVTLPYFITVVRGGTQVEAKRIGRVVLHFNPGQARASATGTATAEVDRAAATLAKSARDKLLKKRKPGEEDAATDPLSEPEIRDDVLSASFEALVGFQLTSDQLKYNVTR